MPSARNAQREEKETTRRRDRECGHIVESCRGAKTRRKCLTPGSMDRNMPHRKKKKPSSKKQRERREEEPEEEVQLDPETREC